jgi:CO/xanthine dehydrogenase FAD-binding subunit
LDRDKNTIKNIHIAVGPGASTPWRARAAEEVLIGNQMNETFYDSSLEVLLNHVGFRSSPRRAGSDYRRHLVETLFKDVLKTAWERAV